jgi:hypothetical protein
MKEKSSPLQPRLISSLCWENVIPVFVIFFLIPATVAAIYPIIPFSRGDWAVYFLPATRAFLNGQSPYNVTGFYSPPWTLIPLIPISLLPERLGSAIISAINPFMFALVAYKMGARPTIAAAVSLSWPVLVGSVNINISFMPLLGLLLPPWLGIFFLLAKPQIGIAGAIFLIFMAWRKGDYKNVIKLLLPITVVTALSFFLYGFWPAVMVSASQNDWNLSFWPWSLPIGVLVFILGIRRNNILEALPASLFLSPYITADSTIVLFFGFLSSTVLTLMFLVLSWVWAYLAWFS